MKKKRLYIASRTASAAYVTKLLDMVSAEFEPAFDCTGIPISSPETNPANRDHAQADLDAARTAEAFVLIDRGTFDGAFGAIFEFGAAAAAGIPCIVVAPLTRESIFHTLPNVTIVDSVEAAAAELKGLAYAEF